jgi:hypothetical protein
VISVAVRWYLRYGLSYRDVEELLAERGVTVDHVTVYRWVQRFTVEFIATARSTSTDRSSTPTDAWPQTTPIRSDHRRRSRLRPKPQPSAERCPRSRNATEPLHERIAA